jgi:uracil-DNA glycosylase
MRTMALDIKLEAGWKEAMKEEFTKPYFEKIVFFLKAERATGKVMFPAGAQIFNAFEKTPYDQVKVVIIGQDPYHGEGQAHGLSFSVPPGVTQPPSLKNIFKELQSDIGIAPPSHGCLQKWAEQGVLLLNASLTVRQNEPNSHSNIGWTEFTNAVIKKLSHEKKGLVFLLWGKYAQDKQVLIDETKHHVLKAAHPSPFSADKGFFGCRHFSKANELLVKEGVDPIDWNL